MKRIAINGFGRIGRLTFRALQAYKDIEIVALNDLTDIPTLAHLLKYDTAHRKFDKEVSTSPDAIMVDGKRIQVFMQKDPQNLPWGDLGVDLVLDCTGVNLSRASLESHLKAGAKKVILSAPPKENDIPTYVLGVNEDRLSASEPIISNASCTTNCLAVLIKILDQAFQFRFASMNTIHAFTQDQRLQDAPHKDLRRARAASLNIIPTSTGAGKAVEEVYSPIKGKLIASSYRVPIITGSLVEMICQFEKPADRDAINEAVRNAAQSNYKGLVEYSSEPLVSSDIIGNPHSAIFDSELTTARQGFAKVVAWYDNEAGYSARLAQMCDTFSKIEKS